MSHAVRQQLLVLRVLWAAITSSTLLLSVVLFVVPRPEQGPEPLMSIMFGAMAAVCAAASFFVPASLRAAALRDLQLSTREEEDPEGMPGFGKKVTAAADPEAAALAALRAIQPSFIISLALSEAVGLFGFMLGFLGAPPAQSMLFLAVAGLLLALRFPRLETALRQLERARGLQVRLPLRDAAP